MDELSVLREEINSIDDKIMTLLDKRYTLTMIIGDIKQLKNITILDTKREDYINDKISKYSHSPQISVVYNTIMSESKKAQRK